MGGCFSKPKPGPNNLPVSVLKDLAEELSAPLRLIFNNSWSTEDVPEEWKTAEATLPVFKKSRRNELVEVKIEVVLPEKERVKEETSPNGKASPIVYKANGTSRHYQLEEHPVPLNPYRHMKDMVEASVCHVKDLDNGQMREVDLGCGKALLVKENGDFYAMGHKCPHYGAPLVKGVLSKGRIRCPWHGACFNIGTGDIEDFPGLDSLPKFQVKIEKEKVYIRASKQALQAQKRTKMMAKCISLSNYNVSSTNVLIIGAGPAGLVCAETLRQEGFSDRIVMCTVDRNLPYDRPKLSKSMDSHADQIALRPKEFFRMNDIEVLTEMQVVAVDVKNKTAIFKDGFKMEYNKLLLATGNTPKTLSCKGKEVENVFTIRTVEDANRVVKVAAGRNAVVVGASFLGMEVAAYLSEKAHSVSVVELEEAPFKKFFGEKVGCALMKMFENNRVKFYMQTEVSELREQDGKLKEVVLKSGKVLRADVCIIGIGATPATGFLKQSGVHLDSKGYIVVNKTMQTSILGVFAAGDAVAFPLALRNHKKTNVPHWQMAHVHGRIAALNMLAHGTEVSTVPYLWTAMFGKSIRYAGKGRAGPWEGFDDVIIRGDLDELKFVAFYTKSDEVLAVASMNYDPLVSKVADVMGSGRTIRKRDVETGDMSWLTGKGS
ncbi:apoptosis-inducing factor 3 [Candoia aspera]|uniref:apoptosis-inducing factor 3 n=1 Tax=Candoia aspera TaxID=51853 RepID=UPI002FD80E2C